MFERLRTPTLLVAVLVCLALALAGQGASDALAAGSSINTTEVVGRAASSYLTGIRTFAAAALWNRIDPLMHGYYDGVALDDQTYMLSTIAAVQALDPHAVRSYFVGAWLLAQNDRVDEGIDMAERGLAENPNEGILIVNVAQLLSLYTDDIENAADVAETALGDDVVWQNATDEHSAYAVMAGIFREAGREDLYELVRSELERIDAEAGDELPAGSHDHDGDGVPDH